METLTIVRPDDWHLHVRDGAMLETVLPFSAREFSRAIIMPNLVPAIKTADEALAYKARIEAVIPNTASFTPLMTIYLTDKTTPEVIREASTKGITAVKYYPRGATTNSDEGVTDLTHVYPALQAMTEVGMPLLIHGEANIFEEDEVDPYDKEKVFIEHTLLDLIERFKTLKISLEHITSRTAVSFLKDKGSERIVGTVTPQHLMIDRRDIFRGGFQVHRHCLPPAKRREDKEALRAFATSGTPHLFLGTDSAPHPTHKKEAAAGCAAGCFTAPYALELYLQVFDEMNALEHFEAFASKNGPAFYGLPENTETVTLRGETWQPGTLIPVGDTGEEVRPFGYYEDTDKNIMLTWKLAA